MEAFWYSKKMPSIFRKFCQQANSISGDCQETASMVSSRTGSERLHENANGRDVTTPLVDHQFSFSFLPNDARDTGVNDKNKADALETALKWQAEIKDKCKKKCSFGKYNFEPTGQGGFVITSKDPNNSTEQIVIKKDEYAMPKTELKF